MTGTNLSHRKLMAAELVDSRFAGPALAAISSNRGVDNGKGKRLEEPRLDCPAARARTWRTATSTRLRELWSEFVEEIRTGRLYAVHVGIIRFDRLSAETTTRWLAAPCPGRRLASDKADLETRFSAERLPF
jgi:hypothetical protein